MKLMDVTLLCLLMQAYDALFTDEELERNFCSKLQIYEDSYVVPITKRIKETVQNWCFSIPPRCTEYRFKTVTEIKTVTVNKTRIIYECCPGHEKKDGLCKPACNMGCDNGVCIRPEVCLCNEGWTGLFCSSECEPNRYGKGCKNKCACLNGARCDSKNGFCYCTAGFAGEFCENTCPKGTYGQDCQFKCLCENDGICDVFNGICTCQDGYTGQFCHKPCEPGTHGPNCKNKCICLEENTESCNKTNGACICKPGFQGIFCERECENNTYGVNCNNQCDCENFQFCDNIDGKCICNPGWIGDRCSKKCPIGKFGEDCIFTCVPCLNDNAVCNHVTGYCDCPNGTSGEFCTEMCPKGFWGSNCTKTCDCPNDGLCSPVSGACLCTSDLDGDSKCSENCSSGFGVLCSSECGCVCDEMTGKCHEVVNAPWEKVDATNDVRILQKSIPNLTSRVAETQANKLGNFPSVGGLITGICLILFVLCVFGISGCAYIVKKRKGVYFDCCRRFNTTVDPAEDDIMTCGAITNPMYDSPIRRQIEREVNEVCSIDFNPVSSSSVINFSHSNNVVNERSSEGAMQAGGAKTGEKQRSSAPANLATRSRNSAGSQEASNEFNFFKDIECEISKPYIPEVLNEFSILDEEANLKI